MTLRGLVHAHSWHSFDSILPPRAYLAWAARRGLDFLCLTDHNTIAGSVELARLNRDSRLQVVVGAEYATDRGDLVGLFLTEEIRDRRWPAVVDAIRGQGGLVLLPHPHRNHRLDESIWADVDLVEVFNARSTVAANDAGLRDAIDNDKPQLAATDCHTLWELLRDGTIVDLEGDGDLRRRLLDAPRSFTSRRSSPNLTRYSQRIKAARRRLGRPGVR